MDNLEIPKETVGDKTYSIVKGAIGSLPGFGSIAAETFGLILAQPITKRREKWMLTVVEELKKLERSIETFKIENLKDDDEFVTFLIETSQLAFKTHQEKKLEYLRNSISNYFSVQIDFDKKHSFIRLIDDLTPTHINILQFILYNENHIIEHVNDFSALLSLYHEKESTVDKFHFRKFVRDLHNVSLIRISGDFGDFIGGGGFATDESAPSIKMLDFGKEFLEFVLEDSY